MSNRTKRNNRYTSIPEVRDDLQSIATAVRALKQTVEVLSRQSGSEDDWAATVADVANVVTTVTSQTNNTDWSQILNDPTIDVIFDRAAAKADKLAQDMRDEARVALAKLQTAFDNFKNGYDDDNAIVRGQISRIDASLNDNEAKIVSEQIARVTATQSLAGRIDTVSAQTQGSLAAVTTDIATLTTEGSALATRVDTVTTASTGAKTYIQSTAPVSLTTNAYWVDLSSDSPVVKQYNGTTFVTQTATVASIAPTSYTTGTLWFDTGVGLLKRWSGSAWVTQAAFVQSKTPTTIAVGDYWLDTATANTLKRWDGTSWVAVSQNDNVFGILLSSVISESISRTDNDRTTATRIANLISIAPDGNSATINNTQITTTTRTEALASDLTSLEVQTTGGSAGGFYRLLASSSPADGALAEFQIQVRAAESGANSTFSTAGMRIQAMSGGVSRVKFNTDQFIIANSTNTYTPFAVTSGQLALNAFVAATNITGNITTGQITGLGTLATKNSVSALTEVSNLNAIATLAGKITAANSATFIDNGAIVNALIGNAAIANANIGTAAVDTLKIAGNAVTVAQTFSSLSDVNNIGLTEVDVISGTVTLTGTQPVLVQFSGFVGGAASSGGTATPFDANVRAFAYIGTNTKTIVPDLTIYSNNLGAAPGVALFTGIAAGTYTVRVAFSCTNGTQVFVRAPSIIILETKR